MNTTTTQQENTIIYPSTIVSNIYCKKCKNVLPPHTVERHLSMDENDPIYKCPHKDFEPNGEIDLDDYLYPLCMDWSFDKPIAPHIVVYVFNTDIQKK